MDSFSYCLGLSSVVSFEVGSFVWSCESICRKVSVVGPLFPFLFGVVHEDHFLFLVDQRWL